jgi:deoxyguanosine kinase
MQRPRSGRRIEICGGIASGKTTLARILSRYRRCVAFEYFKKNPFWKLFYQDPVEYSFAAEVTFLLQHCTQIKIQSRSSKTLICDFSTIQDRAYADINLTGGQLSAFDAVYRQAISELEPPSLIVHLECSASEELRRIRRRSRRAEVGIRIEYLDALHHAIARQLVHLPNAVRVLTINSEYHNFARNKATQEQIAGQVLRNLPKGAV